MISSTDQHGPCWIPPIQEGLQLAPGQKTRGWVVFEIDADTEVKAVGYGLAELSLPEA